WKLESEAAELTRVPTFALNFSCPSATLFQTSVCERDWLTASFKSFVATRSVEESKRPTDSLPRRVQRPLSTQKASTEMRPECGGTSMSTPSTRSCCPP